MMSFRRLIGLLVVLWIAGRVSAAISQSGGESSAANQKIPLSANQSVGKKMWLGYGLLFPGILH
jgi:hypothetical protein